MPPRLHLQDHRPPELSLLSAIFSGRSRSWRFRRCQHAPPRRAVPRRTDRRAAGRKAPLPSGCGSIPPSARLRCARSTPTSPSSGILWRAPSRGSRAFAQSRPATDHSRDTGDPYAGPDRQRYNSPAAVRPCRRSAPPASLPARSPRTLPHIPQEIPRSFRSRPRRYTGFPPRDGR